MRFYDLAEEWRVMLDELVDADGELGEDLEYRLDMLRRDGPSGPGLRQLPRKHKLARPACL